jgi:hypothetical protein
MDERTRQVLEALRKGSQNLGSLQLVTVQAGDIMTLVHAIDQLQSATDATGGVVNTHLATIARLEEEIAALKAQA